MVTWWWDLVREANDKYAREHLADGDPVALYRFRRNFLGFTEASTYPYPNALIDWTKIGDTVPNSADHTPNPHSIYPHYQAPPILGVPAPLPTGAVILDPADPFDAALIPIVETNRRKRKDYAADGNPFSNFDTSSRLMGLSGFGPTEAALFNVVQKLARLQSLRTNGRMHDTANESVADTYLDLAVYAIIAYAIYLGDGKYCAEPANVPDGEVDAD